MTPRPKAVEPVHELQRTLVIDMMLRERVSCRGRTAYGPWDGCQNDGREAADAEA
jgi:hypothetical protein